jgi:hypothetical protein
LANQGIVKAYREKIESGRFTEVAKRIVGQIWKREHLRRCTAHVEMIGIIFVVVNFSSSDSAK